MAEKQTIDAMWDDSPVDVSTEVNFIWSIANKLRGTYQSDKYKDVIIPMVIIRRFECALAPTKQKVVDQFRANPAYPAKAMYRVSGYQFYNTTDLQNDKRSLRTGLVKEHGIITSAYIDLCPIKHVDSRYFHYLLHAYDVTKVFYNMGNGVRQGLNYSVMGEKDDDRIEFVQFHQNYSYEDFMMGYKPVENGFELKYGIFYRFCKKAANHPDKDYFFIIDEINRGNMSKIFGELLMLIEADYRDKKATLAYNGLSFSVPKRLHIIGMMNTADRSLAMIDYALRRRFSFFDMEPGFDSEGFINYQNSFANETFNTLIERIKELNKEIAQDKSLGKGFCIGHSYFCNADDCTEEWMKDVVDFEILPMLSEYWFDESSKLQRWENILHGVFQ